MDPQADNAMVAAMAINDVYFIFNSGLGNTYTVDLIHKQTASNKILIG